MNLSYHGISPTEQNVGKKLRNPDINVAKYQLPSYFLNRELFVLNPLHYDRLTVMMKDLVPSVQIWFFEDIFACLAGDTSFLNELS